MYYGTPPIVTNGLVLNLDAASPKAAPTRNLLIYTTDLTNAAWTKVRSQITASATTAPDGTNTAFAWNISPDGTSALVRLTGTLVTTSVYGGQVTFSVYVKNRNCTATDFNVAIYNGSYSVGLEPIYYIPSNFAPVGAVGNTTFFNAVRRSEDVGNGWNRISYTTSVTSSLNSFNLFFDIEAGGGTKVAGEGIYIWGPQFETGPVPTPYQPVTGTTKPWPSIGSTITGSMISNPTWISSNGGTVVFDGVNDSVSIPYTIQDQFTNQISINVWINAQSFIGFGSDGVAIIGKNHTSLTPPYTVWDLSATPAGNISGIVGNGSTRTSLISATTLSLNTWSNVTFTYDGTTLKLYVNGIQDSNTTTATYTLGQNTVNPSIGSNPVLTPYNDWFKGGIAQVQVYNRALTQQEITQNYNALKSRFI